MVCLPIAGPTLPHIDHIEAYIPTRTRDLTDIAYIKDSNETILTDEDEIKAKWQMVSKIAGRRVNS